MCEESNAKAFVVNSQKVFDTNNFFEFISHTHTITTTMPFRSFFTLKFFLLFFLRCLSPSLRDQFIDDKFRSAVNGFTHYASIKLMNQTHLFLLLWIVYTSWQPNTNNSSLARHTHTNPSLCIRYAKMIEMMNVTEMSMLLNTQNVLINFKRSQWIQIADFSSFFVFETEFFLLCCLLL